jgi:hypothetical protein
VLRLAGREKRPEYPYRKISAAPGLGSRGEAINRGPAGVFISFPDGHSAVDCCAA